MAGRSAAQLVDIRLVEDKRIDDSYFQDYGKIHERLERILEKEPKPLREAEANAQADAFVAWLSGQEAKGVPAERLSMFLRVGLGHICAEMIAAPPSLSLDEIAARAFAELQRRGWDLAVYDPEVAADAVKRVEDAAKAARAKGGSGMKKEPSSAAKHAGVSAKVAKGTPKVAVAKASPKAAPAKKEALMIEKKKSPAKPAAAKKAPAKKAAAKKPAAKKPAAKKVAEKKAPAKKAAAKKPAAKKAVAKKPVAKKAAAKKPVAKRAAAKKPVAKKAAAKKPAAKKVAEKKAPAKKPAAKKAVAKKPAAKKAPKAAEPKPAPAPVVAEEKKPEIM
jgi:hypothetical protein